MDFSNKTYAIIGASKDPSKYGNRVLRDLKDAGYTVFPVNPKETEIEGIKAYKNVKDVPEAIDTAVIVVPPAVTNKVLPEIKEKGIKHVWFQPGSQDDKALAYCDENGIEETHNMCIMVMRKQD